MNRDKILARNKELRMHPERSLSSRIKKTKQQTAETKAAWYQKNKEDVLKKQKIRRQSPQVKRQQTLWSQRWRKENSDKTKQYNIKKQQKCRHKVLMEKLLAFWDPVENVLDGSNPEERQETCFHRKIFTMIDLEILAPYPEKSKTAKRRKNPLHNFISKSAIAGRKKGVQMFKSKYK